METMGVKIEGKDGNRHIWNINARRDRKKDQGNMYKNISFIMFIERRTIVICCLYWSVTGTSVGQVSWYRDNIVKHIHVLDDVLLLQLGYLPSFVD